MKRILCLLFVVFVATGALAIEGVSPGSYEVDFEPGLEGEFIFDFVLNEVGDVRIEGALSEYFSVDKERIVGRDDLIVSMKLPESLGSMSGHDSGEPEFGTNVVWFFAGDVVGIVKINVPYPERFIELRLSAGDVNFGDDVEIGLRVSNFGSSGRNVRPEVKVYLGEDVVEVFNGEERWLDESGSTFGHDSGEPSLEYEFLLSGENYSVGEYFVVASVDEFVGEDFFKIGEFGLKILNYTEVVRAGGPRKFEVVVESLSDNKIDEVWAEIRVIGQLKEGGVSVDRVGGFDSSIVSLGGWEKRTLVGYFDTKGFEGEVMLSIDVNYDGSVESEVVRVEVLKNWFWFWVGGFFGLVVLVLGWWFWKSND